MPVFFRIVLVVDWFVALSWMMRVLSTILLRSRGERNRPRIFLKCVSIIIIEAEGFVLAGGHSTRMGQDKALLQVAGRSLLDLALDKLRAVPLAAAPRIAGTRSELSSHAPVIADLHPGCGPLSGIEAALAASRQPLNVFLPVDTPLLPAQFLVWMVRRAEITGALVTVPCINGWPQPLCAVYHRQSAGPHHRGAASQATTRSCPWSPR